MISSDGRIASRSHQGLATYAIQMTIAITRPYTPTPIHRSGQSNCWAYCEVTALTARSVVFMSLVYLAVIQSIIGSSMEASIFTKIINGDIPSHKIYEDEHVYAFLDIHPIAPGHTLVVPKQQVEFVWDLDDVTYGQLQAAVKKLALHLRETLDVPYVGEQIIGVDVPHAHIHLVPFTEVSEYRNHPDPTAEPDHQALADMAAKLAF